MYLEYITVIKDYEFDKNKISARFLNEIRNRMRCELYSERIKSDVVKARKNTLVSHNLLLT